MAISASQIATTNTLEQFRTEFNNLLDDVSGLESGTISFSAVTSTSLESASFVITQSGTVVFEGATIDAFETTLTVVDPTADRTITFPDASGTVIVSDSSSNVTTLPDDLLIKNNGTIGSASSTSAITIASSGIVTFVDDILIKDGGTIGSASSTTAITVSSGGIVTFVDDIVIKDGGTIGVVSTVDAMTVSSAGIVTFKDDIVIKDGGTIGTGTTPAAITIASGGNVTLSGDLTISGDDLVMGTNTAGMLLIADGTNFNPTAITSLSEISTVANDDVFLAIDTSGGGLKKIAKSAITAGLASSSAISNIVEDTSPQLGANLDTNSHNILIDDAHFIGDENGNEQIVFQTTSSAVNQIEVTNAASGSGVQIASTGGDTNIDLKLLPKGSGKVVMDGNVGIETGVIDLKNGGTASKILFYCESSNAHAQTVQSAPHSVGATNTLTLPGGSTIGNGAAVLVSDIGTQTITNKTLTSPKINEDVAVTSTATELNVLDGITAVVGELNALDIGSTAVGTAVASKAVILDSDKDYTGIRNFSITGNLSVGGTTTVVDTVTMNAQNAVLFEGATADAHETTLTIVDPTADRTINLPNQSGTIPVLAAASNTAVTSTPEELNILDGVTSTAAELNILDGVTSTAAELNVLDGITAVVGEDRKSVV